MIFLYAPILLTFLMVGFILYRGRVAYQQQARIRHLRTWAKENPALDPIVQLWIAQLPAAEVAVLLDLLHGCCLSLKWELDWLFTPQIEKAPALQSALTESVNAYARMILLSLHMEEDVRAYHAYLAFDKQPYARQQQAIVQQLYAKIYGGDGRAVSKKLFRRSARAGTSHSEQVAAVRQAFDRDPMRTMAAFKDLLAAATPTNQATQAPSQPLPVVAEETAVGHEPATLLSRSYES